MREVQVSDTLVNFVTSSDDRVVHFDLLQKHDNFAETNTSCRKWRNCDLVPFAEHIVTPIDRGNSEKFWNSFLMNEITYAD